MATIQRIRTTISTTLCELIFTEHLPNQTQVCTRKLNLEKPDPVPWIRVWNVRVLLSTFYKHNGVRWETSNSKTSRETLNSWKVNNIVLSNPQSQEKKPQRLFENTNCRVMKTEDGKWGQELHAVSLRKGSPGPHYVGWVLWPGVGFSQTSDVFAQSSFLGTLKMQDPI